MLSRCRAEHREIPRTTAPPLFRASGNVTMTFAVYSPATNTSRLRNICHPPDKFPPLSCVALLDSHPSSPTLHSCKPISLYSAMAGSKFRVRYFERASRMEIKTETVVGSLTMQSSDPLALQDSASEDFPDGGRGAWAVVIGACLALFASAGMVNSYVSSSVASSIQN